MKPQYCVTQDAEHKDFDIQAAVATSYPETGLQPLYFVAENMDDMRNKMMWVDSWVAFTDKFTSNQPGWNICMILCNWMLYSWMGI